MSDLVYEFADTGGGEVTGSNDPVTSIFKGRGDLSYHLARESIQNIIDQRNPDTPEPAIANFSLTELKVSDLPGIEQLKKILKACRDADHSSKGGWDFYQRAIKKIEEDRFIYLMKVSDYNTTGLTGDDDDSEGNYFSLMKAVGSSSKSGDAGGSWGLGKGAYFAASSFRSIFVSSVYDGDKLVFQGKTRLRSFKKDNKWIQGNGSFGLPGQKPVRQKKLIPKIFLRAEQGTDIYIIGYEDPENWEEHMIRSILNNFWYAIDKRLLEVSLDRTTISSDNLEDLLERYFDISQPDKDNSPNPWPYYLAYRDGNFLEDRFSSLGKVQLFLLEKEAFPNKVAHIRKTGMVIQKNRYGAPLNYAGVFICENDKGNEILQKMENPAHDEWNKENAKDGKFAKKAELADKEMRSYIRKSVNNLYISESEESLKVGGLEEFLWLEGDMSVGGVFGHELSDDVSKVETGPETGRRSRDSVYSPVTRKVTVIKKITKGSEEGEDPVIDGVGNGGKIGRGKEDEEGEKDVVALKSLKFRTFAVRNHEGQMEHLIVVKGPAGTQCYLEVQAGTDASFDSLKVVRAFSNDREHRVSGNKIYGIELDASEKIKFSVQFADNERYSLNVTAYAYK